MGRPAMSAEEIRENKIRIISAAIEIINESGIESISARSLGNRIGMNSALIYRYFKDIEEVILFSCIHVLQDYASEMTSAMKELSKKEEATDRDVYLISWELFAKHAFTHPTEYTTLFFSKHSQELHRVSKEYYELFPVKLGKDDDMVLQGMFRTPNLHNRNLILLIPVLEGRYSEDDIILINDMTIAFFYYLLDQLIRGTEGLTIDIQIERMMEACRKTTRL